MAVFVCVSCGSSDEGGSGMSPNQAADEIYAIEVTYNKEVAAAIEARDAEMYVKALEKYVAAKEKLAPKVKNLDQSKVDPKKAESIKKLQDSNEQNDKVAQSMFYDEIYNGELSARFKKAIGIE